MRIGEAEPGQRKACMAREACRPSWKGEDELRFPPCGWEALRSSPDLLRPQERHSQATVAIVPVPKRLGSSSIWRACFGAWLKLSAGLFYFGT